jgi:hypothetical protein
MGVLSLCRRWREGGRARRNDLSGGHAEAARCSRRSADDRARLILLDEPAAGVNPALPRYGWIERPAPPLVLHNQSRQASVPRHRAQK